MGKQLYEFAKFVKTELVAFEIRMEARFIKMKEEMKEVTKLLKTLSDNSIDNVKQINTMEILIKQR